MIRNMEIAGLSVVNFLFLRQVSGIETYSESVQEEIIRYMENFAHQIINRELIKEISIELTEGPYLGESLFGETYQNAPAYYTPQERHALAVKIAQEEDKKNFDNLLKQIDKYLSENTGLEKSDIKRIKKSINLHSCTMIKTLSAGWKSKLCSFEPIFLKELKMAHFH